MKVIKKSQSAEKKDDLEFQKRLDEFIKAKGEQERLEFEQAKKANEEKELFRQVVNEVIAANYLAIAEPLKQSMIACVKKAVAEVIIDLFLMPKNKEENIKN